jgi:hypothetical protein
MIIAKPGSSTFVLGACNGPLDYFNDGNHEPDFIWLINKWAWIEFQVDTNGPNGEIRIKIWGEDRIYNGATICQYMTNGRGAGATYGGEVDYLDILGGFMTSIPNPSMGPWYELERVEIVVGSDTDLTPPISFPGSNR